MQPQKHKREQKRRKLSVFRVSMPKVDVITITGAKSGKIDLPKEIFAAKVNPQLMAQAVRVYLVNQRRAGAKVKSRSEVSGSRRKIWRQKGTGRARHGDQYAPIFVGGGVAHGPTGEENYRLKMSKKMKKRALFSALTSKFKAKEILVVKGLEKIEPKTKEMAKIIKNLTRPRPDEVEKLKIKNDSDPERIENSRQSRNKSKFKISVILPEILENIIRAGRNISGLNLRQAKQLNTYEVLNGGKLVFMDKSLEVLKDTFLDKPNKKV